MTGAWLVSYIVLWILCAALAIALVSTLRNLGVVYTMITRMPQGASPQRSTLTPGEALPDVRWYTADGKARTAAEFKGEKTAFAVVSPSCASCGTFLEILLDVGPDPTDHDFRDLVVVSLGDAKQTRLLVEDVARRTHAAIPPILFDRDGEVSRHWGVSATPFTVIVDAEQRVVRQVVGGSAPPISPVGIATARDSGVLAATTIQEA